MGNGKTCPMEVHALSMQRFWLEVLLYTLIFDDFTKHDTPFEVEITFCSVNVKKKKKRKEKRKYLITVYQKTQKGYV